jgi:hypothetical protein
MQATKGDCGKKKQVRFGGGVHFRAEPLRVGTGITLLFVGFREMNSSNFGTVVLCRCVDQLLGSYYVIVIAYP